MKLVEVPVSVGGGIFLLLEKYDRLIQVCRTIRAYFTHLQDNIVLQTVRELRMRKYFEFLLPFLRAK
jgi:hypothetical protein